MFWLILISRTFKECMNVVSKIWIKVTKNFSKQLCLLLDGTTNPDPCENAYGSDSSCDNWASLGYCTQTYVAWMTANCKKSCNLCEDACENTYSNDANCETWANLGYCTQTYVAWMSANCEKACNTCGQQSCENTYSNDASCESWANLGYCTQTYAAWMSANCEKACNTC